MVSRWVFARAILTSAPLREAFTMPRYAWRTMSDKKEPTQRTEQGYEIPVPTRGQVERDFAKIAQPLPPEPKRKLRRRRNRSTK
jgi:hypothetical protein